MAALVLDVRCIKLSCYHPLVAYDISPKDRCQGEKRKISFNPHPELLYQLKKDGRELLIPCGQCIGCRLDYSREWANRCMLELPYHDQAWFITLTYDDAHVPKTFSHDPDTGEALAPVMTLCSRDLQLFLKLLRRHHPDDHIRFFAAGEYGTQSLRPHYHAIIFGLHLNDITVYRKSELGFTYFNSESLSRCWIDGATGQSRGYVVAGAVSWDTCAYVARYMLKKQKGATKDIYDQLGIEPEFSRMSRKPGIAHQYYVDHPEIWQYDKINICTPSGGKSFSHPTYLRHLYEIDDPVSAEDFNALRRQRAIAQNNLKLSLTDLDYYDIIRVEEEKKTSSLTSLFRNKM